MKSLLVALLAAQSASVSARALPYTLEQLERSGVSEDTLAQIENLRVGGEKEVFHPLFLILVVPVLDSDLGFSFFFSLSGCATHVVMDRTTAPTR